MDQQIDENLRRVYTETSGEQIPDRFTKLLEQLRQKERESEPEISDSEDGSSQ